MHIRRQDTRYGIICGRTNRSVQTADDSCAPPLSISSCKLDLTATVPVPRATRGAGARCKIIPEVTDSCLRIPNDPGPLGPPETIRYAANDAVDARVNADDERRRSSARQNAAVPGTYEEFAIPSAATSGNRFPRGRDIPKLPERPEEREPPPRLNGTMKFPGDYFVYLFRGSYCSRTNLIFVRRFGQLPGRCV